MINMPKQYVLEIGLVWPYLSVKTENKYPCVSSWHLEIKNLNNL